MGITDDGTNVKINFDPSSSVGSIAVGDVILGSTPATSDPVSRFNRFKTTKEQILSTDAVSQGLPDPNKNEPISCQALLDSTANAVIASTNASGLHLLPPSGSVIKSYLDSFDILSVKKTTTQTIPSYTFTKLISWDTPHVDINTGTSGWSNTNSRYVIQTTGTYRIDYNATITNTGNDTNSLRLLIGRVMIYNSGATLLHTDSNSTILYNVDNVSGRQEAATVMVSIIRTLNATDYIEIESAGFEAIGNYVLESAILNVEQLR